MQGKAWMEQARRQIKTDLLIKTLQKHATGDKKMQNSQVRAAEILLRKALPDLKQHELTGEIALKQFVVEHNEAEAETGTD